jgi:hypothetical protein
MGCGRPVKPRSLFLAPVYAAGVLACITSANVNAAVVLLDNFDSGTATDGGIGGSLFAQVVGSADLVRPSMTFTKTTGNPESANASNHNIGNLVEDLSLAIGVPEASTGAMIFLWLAALGLAKSHRKPQSPISINFGGVDDRS